MRKARRLYYAPGSYGRYALPHVAASGGGTVIFVSSVNIRYPGQEGQASYVSSKAACHSMPYHAIPCMPCQYHAMLCSLSS
jgi:hypothetical protein